MRKTKKLAAITASLLTITPIIGVNTAYATNETIDALKTKIEEEKGDLEDAEKEIESFEEQIKEHETTIENKKDELLDINIELDEMEEKRLKKYEEIKKRIKYLYENGDTTMLSVLISSKNITSILNKKEMRSKIQSYDQRKLQDYVNLINDIEEEQKLLEDGIAELEEDIKELDDLKEKQQELKEKLTVQIKDDEVALADEIKKEEERKAEEERKRKEEEAKRRAASVVTPSGTVTRVGNTYQYNEQDMYLIYAIVMQEAGNSYDGALAVITCACNRAESSKWGYLGSDPLSQLTARGQFCYSIDSYWKKYLNNNVTQNVRDAVADALNGTRSHQYLSFRGYVVSGGVNIGGNYYFSSMY